MVYYRRVTGEQTQLKTNNQLSTPYIILLLPIFECLLEMWICCYKQLFRKPMHEATLLVKSQLLIMSYYYCKLTLPGRKNNSLQVAQSSSVNNDEREPGAYAKSPARCHASPRKKTVSERVLRIPNAYNMFVNG